MLFVPSNASAEAWYYHLTEPPSYAPYAKNLAMMALESWEDCGLINKTTRECIPLQFFPQPNRDRCLEMRGFINSCFVITWAKEGDGENVGYAQGWVLPDGTKLPGWHMQVSLGESYQGKWRAFSDITVKTIAEHEMGHILGLEHTNDPDSIMYPSVPEWAWGFRDTSMPTPAPAPAPAPAPDPIPSPAPKPSGPVEIKLNQLWQGPPSGFKSGESITIGGYVKNADTSSFVMIKIIDPTNKVVKTSNVVLKKEFSNYGSFSKNIILSYDLPSGYYKFEVKYDSTSVTKTFKFTQTPPTKTSPTPGIVSSEISVEKSRFELSSRENSYAKVSGTIPKITGNDWVFFTITEPDGKIVQTKVKATTHSATISQFENLINISGKKLGKYTVSVSSGVDLKRSNYIGTITFDAVEKSKGTIGLPSTISSIKTNKSSYSSGEVVVISGSIKNYDSSHYNTVSITITDSIDQRKFFKLAEPDPAGQFSITIPSVIEFEDDHYTVSASYMPLLKDYGGFYTYGKEQIITTNFEIGKGGSSSSNQKPDRDSESVIVIPYWVKTNAGWWASEQIDDSSFLQGMQHLIKEGILVIPPTETSKKSSGSQKIPEWIKNNAGWWADEQIDDNSFVSGIQYLVKEGIIRVS